jgi:hypothetical protein
MECQLTSLIEYCIITRQSELKELKRTDYYSSSLATRESMPISGQLFLEYGAESDSFPLLSAQLYLSLKSMPR